MTGISWAPKTNKRLKQQSARLDDLLDATQRTNQLLEWVGAMLYVGLDDAQRAELAEHLSGGKT